jgi:hypothetical protein
MTPHAEPVDSPLTVLRRSNTVPLSVVTAGVGDALDELARAITSQPHATGSRRFRPRPRIALVATVLALVGAGVATAAVVLHARTGVFASGADVPVGGPGEELNLAAPDFRSVALKLSADIPYPTPAGYGSWRDWVLTEQAPGPGGASTNDRVTTGALRGWFAASAFCAWVQDWRQATAAGDSAESQQAASTIGSAPDWSAVTAEDPHPDPSAPNDPGAEPGTLFGWLLPYRAAVLSGDRATVEQLLASGYGDGKCWLSDPQWMSDLNSHDAWSKLSPQGIAQRYRQFLSRERP